MAVISYLEKKYKPILAICGGAGSGKTTISRYLCQNNCNAIHIISHTTRKPRIDDIEDEYIYYDEMEFIKFKDKLLWIMKINGDYYGTLKKDIDYALSRNKLSILITNVEVLNILNNYSPKLVNIIYLYSPDNIITERLIKRGLSTKQIDIKLLLEKKWRNKASYLNDHKIIPIKIIKNVDINNTINIINQYCQVK